MISSIQSNARRKFYRFLEKHSAEIEDLFHVPITETDLYTDFEDLSLHLTHFDDIYDTLLYSRLITQAIDDSTKILVDLGAGSSIPTLLALKRAQCPDVQTIAVDIDPEALKVSQRNAASIGLSHSYSYIHTTITSILDSNELRRKGVLIVSNPPYIPTPKNVSDYHLIPINGGWDGTEYLAKLLDHEHPEGMTLALLWGSLSNPIKMMEMIEDKYEVLYLQATRIHFGHYTQIPIINAHLYELRDKGYVIFDNEERGETQIVVGSILKRKAPSK
jgi:precorrin-6B methylase 2